MDDSQLTRSGLYQNSMPSAPGTDGHQLTAETSSIPRSTADDIQSSKEEPDTALSIADPDKDSKISGGNSHVKFRTVYIGVNSGEEVATREKSQLQPEEEEAVLEYVEVRKTIEIDQKKHAGDKVNGYIKLLSPAVNEALRCVVDYCPPLDMSEELMKIYEPFAPIFFYEKELEEYRNRVLSLAEKADSTCANRHAYEHIGIVLDFVRSKMAKAVDEERRRHARGFASFDMLWLLYKPGCDIYSDWQEVGEHNPGVVQKTELNVDPLSGEVTECQVFIFVMDGNSYYVGPESFMSSIPRFAGEKTITSLILFPCEYIRFMDGVTEHDAEKTRQHFIERGKTWYSMRRKPACYSFNGTTVTVPRQTLDSLVMVDPVQWPLRSHLPGENAEKANLAKEIAHRSAPLKVCSCEHCGHLIYKHAVKPRFAGYSEINPLKVEKLTDHQYFLCDRAVEVFIFKSRTWGMLHVDGFEPAKFDLTLWDRLVLKEETKALIKNLTAMYTSDKSSLSNQDTMFHRKIATIHRGVPKVNIGNVWSADSVGDKGEGLTFLLHGPPGVGKTYTAECIAAYTKRPLMYLTCTDIGVDPTTVERNLAKWFKLAESWGAILLIDEADIYMEQRQVQDIARNHLVAGFLRALEYFKGILFLTTNRVGTFDEAFISRIHIQIYYPPFTEVERARLWTNVFEKLELDRETMRILQSTKDYVESKELRDLEWNGREIRNAFQVAVALAQTADTKDSQDRVLVKSEHIKATVQMSREFKDYLKNLHKKDLSRRAAQQGNRIDAYGSATESREAQTSDKY